MERNINWKFILNNFSLKILILNMNMNISIERLRLFYPRDLTINLVSKEFFQEGVFEIFFYF
jgi:hypothetical protein